MNLKEKLVLFAATGGCIGKIPFVPGTFGTLAGIPFAMALLVIPVVYHGVYLTGLILFAVYIADQAEIILGKKDPGCIVIDEIAGYVVALSMVPVQISTLAAGFFIFRFFDILKPFPVRYFERNFSGGAGVVLDDIMAGVLSALVLWMICLLDLI